MVAKAPAVRHVPMPADRLASLLGLMCELGRQATVACDDELRVLAFNRRFEVRVRDLFGASVDPGQNIRDVLPQPVLAELLAMEKHVPADEPFATEYHFIDAGGVARDAELRARRFDGGLVISTLDLEDRKTVERTLRERERQLRTAMEAGRIVPWEWEIEADVVRRALDTTGIVGAISNDLKSFLDTVHPEDRPAIEAAIEATLAHGAPYRISYRKVVGEGLRWLDARARVVRDDEGRPLKLVGVVVDVTDKKELELQLLQAQKMEAIGRLAGGVAHDFNNLLTAITTSAHLIVRKFADARGPVNDILEASDRAAALTRQLLAFSRRQILRPTTVDLAALVRDVSSMMKRIVGEDIELVTDLRGDLVLVTGDVTQLHQILLNLVVNARDAMPTGGTLRIAAENVDVDADRALALGVEPGLYARLRVSDTGVGMDAATRARAFEPFFTTKDPGAGTGLGLATVYGIASQLGGAVTVESQPGRGATFDVFLLSAAATPANTTVPRAEAAPAHGETILLVEDDGMVRRLTREILELAGYVVLEADRGAEALELAATYRNEIDLLLTDVVMPQMSGMSVARALLRDRPTIKVLFTSGYTDDAVLRHGVVEGQVALLRKPYSPGDLAQAVRRALDVTGHDRV